MLLKPPDDKTVLVAEIDRLATVAPQAQRRRMAEASRVIRCQVRPLKAERRQETGGGGRRPRAGSAARSGRMNPSCHADAALVDCRAFESGDRTLR